MSKPVVLQRQDSVALLTLNRPEKLNAINYETNDLLLHHLASLENDQSVGAIIVTGAGTRAFSAGADIDEFSRSIDVGVDRAVRDFVQRGQAMTSRLETFPKPVVAAVGGIAFGGGCEITEAAHLAVASERATFAKPEIKIGIPPTFGGTQRLPRLTGRKRALEYLLTGDVFSAERARDLGIINRIVRPENLLAEAFTLARQIVAHPPQTIAAILKAVRCGLDRPMADGLRAEREAFASVAATAATKNALKIWLERR